MAKSSLEYAVENYGMELCRTHPALKGRTMRHSDNRQKSEGNALIFTATRGPDRLDGPKGADVMLTVEHKSANRTPAENDLVVAAIDEAFEDDWIRAQLGKTTAAQVFSVLYRMDEKEADRSESNNLRKRSRQIPFIAKLL